MKRGDQNITNVKLGTVDVIKIYKGTNVDWSKAPSINPETVALFNRATTEGFTVPDTTLKTQIDTLITSFKDKGIWNKFDFYFNFCYNNVNLSNFSRINWKNPSGSLATFSGVTYGVKGTSGNGSNAFVNTNWTASTQKVNYALLSASYGVIMGTAGNSYELVGSVGGEGYTKLLNGSGNHYCNSQTGQGSVNCNMDVSSIGLKAISRNATNTYGFLKTTMFTNTSNSLSILTPTAMTFHRNGDNYGQSGIACGYASSYLEQSDINNLRLYYNIFLQAIGLTAFA